MEKEPTSLEHREKSCERIVMDTPGYNQNRQKLIQILGKINSVANPDGMGRDDLSNDILLAAEGIVRRVSPH
jgi:signal recognition particle GTPase